MSLRRVLRRNLAQVAGIVGLVAIASVVAAYILAHQRLRFPWEDLYDVRAEFAAAQGVTPGQGQSVAVAGVVVGEVARVELRGGRALVTLRIEREKLPAVRANARMLLRPKTGLGDMSVELDPGTPAAPPLRGDDVLPVGRTAPDVHLDEVLAALDADTRAWLRTLLNAGGRGLDGRGADLRAIFKAGAPTLRRTRMVTEAVNARRVALARLVHNIRRLGDAVARKDEEVGRLVESADATFSELAANDAALRASLRRLPATLTATRRALSAAGPLARELRPALVQLRPAVRDLAPALPRLDPLLRDGAPAATRLGRLARAAVPVTRDLRPAVRDLARATPALSRGFGVLNYVANELAFNPTGPEEGYLFWLAWFFHNAASMLSIDDAQGAVWRGQVIVSCSSIAFGEQFSPLLRLLATSPACPPDVTRSEAG